MDFMHIPILLDECLYYLNCHPNGIYSDGTIGGGGHSYEILRRSSPNGILIGIDRDMDAIQAASKKLHIFNERTVFINDNFSNIKLILSDLHIDKIDGMLLDLGVSSYQLDNKERGFSYQSDAPLDMRMNMNEKISAFHIINEYSMDELTVIIRNYGEEKWARRIAEFIIKERSKKTIDTTGALVDVIKNAIPAAARRKGPHPAKRTFQAIRIEVNKELEHLEHAITNIIDVLKPGGRLCIITFHSLEDRIVKLAFRKTENPCTCPSRIPICICGKTPLGKVITRKPVIPTDIEVMRNPRARSAKLRVVEKLTSF